MKYFRTYLFGNGNKQIIHNDLSIIKSKKTNLKLKGHKPAGIYIRIGTEHGYYDKLLKGRDLVYPRVFP